MSKLILYYSPSSPVARACLMLIKYLQLEVEVRTLDLSKSDQFSEEFLKVNPAHQVPTLVDGNFVLTESRAILRYLVNSRQPGSNLYPTDPKKRAQVDQRLCFDSTLFTKNGLVVRPIFYSGAKEVSQAARDGVTDTLKVIETFLDNSKWIAGDNLTIADFSLLTIVTTMHECGYDLAQHSNLNRWFKQCQSIPNFEENRHGAKELADRMNAAINGTIF